MHGDAKFSREVCMGCRIPCSVGDTKNTEGVPQSLGDLTQGCQILGGARSPMTPEHGSALNIRSNDFIRSYIERVTSRKREKSRCEG